MTHTSIKPLVWMWSQSMTRAFLRILQDILIIKEKLKDVQRRECAKDEVEEYHTYQNIRTLKPHKERNYNTMM